MFSIDFFSLTKAELSPLASDKLRDSFGWQRTIWQFVDDWFSSSRSVFVFSSGSTGVPRSIEHSKDAMRNSANATCQALQLLPGDNALLCLPADKIGGMMMLVRCIENKMPLYCIQPVSDPLKNIPGDVKIDFAAFTPMQLSGIMKDDSLLEKAGSIGKIILGGEGIQPELMAKIQPLANEVYATFGMTETISHIALKRLNGTNPHRYFKTLPGIDIATNAQGQLIINASGLRLKELHTNDIINLISPTEFEWLGRSDNVINTGGIKVYPEQVETALSPEVPYPFFIASIPDVTYGEKVVLVVETDRLTPGEQESVVTACHTLDKYQQPKEILLVPVFERTANNKLKRKESVKKAVTSIVL